jgi:hypothetical protein
MKFPIGFIGKLQKENADLKMQIEAIKEEKDKLSKSHESFIQEKVILFQKNESLNKENANLVNENQRLQNELNNLHKKNESNKAYNSPFINIGNPFSFLDKFKVYDEALKQYFEIKRIDEMKRFEEINRFGASYHDQGGRSSSSI